MTFSYIVGMDYGQIFTLVDDLSLSRMQSFRFKCLSFPIETPKNIILIFLKKLKFWKQHFNFHEENGLIGILTYY